MKWKAIAVAGLGAIVVAAIAALPTLAAFLAAKVKTALERGGQVSVGKVEVGLLQRRLTLLDVHSQRQGDFAAKRWQATGLAPSLADLLHGRLPVFAFRPGDPLHADRVVL